MSSNVSGLGWSPTRRRVDGQKPRGVPQRQVHDEQFRGAVNVGGFDLLIDDAGGQFERILCFQGRANILFVEFAVFMRRQYVYR